MSYLAKRNVFPGLHLSYLLIVANVSQNTEKSIFDALATQGKSTEVLRC